jgi:hypothetical protein
VAAIFRKSQAILMVEMAPPWAGWEGSITSRMMINLAKWDELPKAPPSHPGRCRGRCEQRGDGRV